MFNMIQGQWYGGDRRQFITMNPRPCFWFLTTEEPLCPWERPQSLRVDEGAAMPWDWKRGCSVQWQMIKIKSPAEGSARQDQEARQNPTHQSPVQGAGLSKDRNRPLPSPMLGKGQERAHSERWFIPRDRCILKRLFMPLQMIPNWTWNRLFQCRGDCLNQKRLEYCLLASLNFPRYSEGWDLWRTMSSVEEKRSTFSLHLSVVVRKFCDCSIYIFFDLNLEPLFKGYSNR